MHLASWSRPTAADAGEATILLTHRLAGAAQPGRARAGRARRRKRSDAALEAPAVVAGFDDVAVVSEAVEQRGGRLGIADMKRESGARVRR